MIGVGDFDGFACETGNSVAMGVSRTRRKEDPRVTNPVPNRIDASASKGLGSLKDREGDETSVFGGNDGALAGPGSEGFDVLRVKVNDLNPVVRDP